jgi:predicted aldo/keto reductase-like oxidoreductase
MERKKNISRRDFFKVIGATGIATAGLTGFRLPERIADTNLSLDKSAITRRTHPRNGDQISLLGYGCMRWPTLSKPGDKEVVIDQEAVNRLVDHALESGLNYFDTSPIYQERKSEPATGLALSRHPRDSYFIATKMSNHHIDRAGITGKAFVDASKEMYRNSFKNLRTDYIDYYLMHNIGTTGGWPLFQRRFLDSGILDFLLEERAAGRIRNLGFSFHGEIKTFEYMMEHNDRLKLDFAQIQMNYVDYRHATGWNTNAEYLYTELEKQGIPVVIMEPLRAGKLANLPEPLAKRLKQAEPDRSVASWAFRFAGSFPRVMTVLSGMTYMEHLQDNLRTYSPLRPCSKQEFDLLEEIATEYAKTDNPK